MSIDRLLSRFLLSLLFVIPGLATADQTDTRLDGLFVTLQSSDNESELAETEGAIWEIWFSSGDEEIDQLMEEASNAVGSGELEIAEALYTRVIRQAPRFSEGWNRRATVRYYQRDYEGSLDDIEQTLVLEPRHFGAIWGLGMILGLQKNFSGAIAAFERLLEIKPNSRDAQPRIDLLRQELSKNAV